MAACAVGIGISRQQGRNILPVSVINNRIRLTADSSRLAEGPARLVSIIPFLMLILRWKRAGLIGTGLAQPIPPIRNAIEPIGSRCASGFMVSRPASAAVSSPRRQAAQAWAIS